MNYKLISILLVSVILASCYITKPLNEEKTIKIISDFDVEITEPYSPKYINDKTKAEYKAIYIAELKREMGINKLKVVESNPDFTISISNLILKEGVKTETVNDEKSEYNGQTYELSTCDAYISYTLYVGDKTKKIDDYNSFAGKDEKVTSNRSLSDYIAGSNKDNSNYRHKGLNQEIFSRLSKKVGRRTCTKITKKINKYSK